MIVLNKKDEDELRCHTKELNSVKMWWIMSHSIKTSIQLFYDFIV